MNTMEAYRKFYEESALAGLAKGLWERFGGESEKALMELCGKYAERILQDYQSLNNDAMQRHLCRSIAPTIGAYLALTEQGMDRGEAQTFLEGLFMQAAEKKRQVFHQMTERPDFYAFFFNYGKQAMLQDYPQEYWDTEMVLDSDRAVAFNIRKCIYWEACQRYGCPALCEIFCKSDLVAMEGVSPQIQFGRTQTIGTGGSCCDFSFTASQ